MPFLIFLAVLCSLWDLSSLTRDQIYTPALEVRSLNHWTTEGSPRFYFCKQLSWFSEDFSSSEAHSVQLNASAAVVVRLIYSCGGRRGGGEQVHRELGREASQVMLGSLVFVQFLLFNNTYFPRLLLSLFLSLLINYFPLFLFLGCFHWIRRKCDQAASKG